MVVQPYLFFDGRCEEALGFYEKMLGAKVLMMMRFKESPVGPEAGMMPPNAEEKIMHARFQVGESVVMASDGRNTGTAVFKGFSLSITTADEAEAGRIFAALSEGGQIRMPMTKTFFSPCFGMVADRFGVGWMVIVEG
jgi:PhnB protein